MSDLGRECAPQIDEKEMLDDGLLAAAQIIATNPRRLAALELFMDDTIHRMAGVGITSYGDERTFWHDHGTAVAPNSEIFRVRTDEYGVAQVYVSAIDSRGRSLFSVVPHTYDCFISPDGMSIRADFVNGVSRAAPRNTDHEAELQRQEGYDVTRPRHREGLEFDPRRDSVVVTRLPDRQAEGHIPRWRDQLYHPALSATFGV